jgi:acetyl esterase
LAFDAHAAAQTGERLDTSGARFSIGKPICAGGEAMHEGTTPTHLRYDPEALFAVKDRDVEYRRVGGRSLLAHVYEPQGPGPFPMLVDIHGGGWNRFDRMRDKPVDIELASHGLVVASLDFRLNGEAPHPAAMEDINFAIRWFKAHADEFHARPEGMGGLGFSSGGHQVLVAGLRPSDPRYVAADAPSGVDAGLAYVICSGCGYDLVTTMVEQGPIEPREHDMFRLYDYFGGVKGVRLESPQHILDSAEAIARPAILLVQAGGDVLPGFTNDKAAQFARTYVERGGNVELVIFPGAPHIFINPGLVERSEAMDRGLAAVRSYIARQLAYLAARFKK